MTDLFEQSSQKLDAAITEIQHAIAAGLANKRIHPVKAAPVSVSGHWV